VLGGTPIRASNGLSGATGLCKGKPCVRVIVTPVVSKLPTRLAISGSRSLSLKLTCHGSGFCQGSASVISGVATGKAHAAAAKRAKRIKVVVVATARYRIRQGHRGVIVLRLTRSGRKLVHARRSLSAMLVVTGSDRAGNHVARTGQVRLIARR
jgi:hypothetical protein